MSQDKVKILHWSKISVIPKNWEKSNADFKKKWRIFYTFYEPGLAPKQVAIRGMNRATSLKEKQCNTRDLIEDESDALKAGYNPNRKQFISNESSPTYTLESALLFALEKKKLEPETRRVVKSRLNTCLVAAKKLGYHNLSITDIERRHIVDILDDFTDTVYNECRARLKLLFKELVRRQIIKFNPVDEFVETRKTVKKIRVTLTKEERIAVDKHLKENHYTFWRFNQIFYASGAREIELIRLRKCDVDLYNQEYKVTLKKGKYYHEVLKVINNDILYLWQEIMMQAGENDYLFSKGLVHGSLPIKSYQITKRWNRLVKKKLGIKADFYSQKHTRTTKLSAKYGIKIAAELNSHKGDVLVKSIYDVNYAKNEREALKAVNDKYTD